MTALAFPSARQVMALVAGYGDERAYAEGKPRSPKWRAKRDKWLREHNACRGCGRGDYLEVHHKVPFSWAPEWELEEWNYITLCEHPALNCHLRLGHCGLWTRANPTVELDAALSLKSMTGYQVKTLYHPGDRY